jgi:methyl-accepting chemotaxis protein
MPPKTPSPARSTIEPKSQPEPQDRAPRMRFGLMAHTTIAMVVVGLLPLALFGGVTLKQQGDRIRSEAEQSMQASAERISGQVDEWIDKNVRALQAAANLPAVVSMKRESQSEVLAAVRQAYPWMYLVFTIGPDGQNVARSDEKPLADYADRQYYKDVVSSGKELSWETLIGKTSKKPALVIAVPIKANGRVVGVMASAMTIEDISGIVANWKAGSTGFAFLVDEKGKVVAHPRESFVMSQTSLADHPLVASLRSNRQGHLTSFIDSDRNKCLGYVQRNKLRWAVAVQQEDEEVFAQLRQTLTVGLWLLAAAAVLVALIARFSSTRLTRPILEMARAADQMSLGELEQPIVSSRSDELGLLAQSLERLRKSMRAALRRINAAQG